MSIIFPKILQVYSSFIGLGVKSSIVADCTFKTFLLPATYVA